MGSFVVVALAALALSIRCGQAAEYVVGQGVCLQDAWGYDLGCDYSNWALTHEYVVGDKLVFNFVIGNNNVAEVTKMDYDGCTIFTPTNPIYVSGRSPTVIPLTKTGTFYFISTALGLPSFCSWQRMAITVSATSTSTPSPSDSSTPTSPRQNHTPTTSTTTTTTNSSASSSSHSSTVTKAVVGSVVGFVLFVAKIIIIVYCMKRRKNQQKIKLQLQMAHPPVDHADGAEHVLGAA